MNIISGCIFFSIVLLNDYNFYALVIHNFKKPVKRLSLKDQAADGDIQIEEHEITNNTSDEVTKESAFILENLLKASKNIHAVHQLSLNKDPNEDKTTFKIMTGTEEITSGDVWVKRKCPKTMFNNFIPELTGRETLKIFALNCGFKMDEIEDLINQMAIELEFHKHLDKQVKDYDGQNRKKLLSALALMGNPDVIFLDVSSIFSEANLKILIIFYPNRNAKLHKFAKPFSRSVKWTKLKHPTQELALW